MGGRGSSSGGDPRNRYGKSFDIGKYNINDKKFRPREKANLEESLKWMEKHFGDFSEAAGEIKKKYLGRGRVGEFDSDAKETRFNTDSFATSEDMIHEFTHAVVEEMARNCKALGFKDRDEFLNTIRTEAYKAAGREEPKYDGRRWKDRAEEFPSRMIETVFTVEKYNGDPPSGLDGAALATLKKYWKQYNRRK